MVKASLMAVLGTVLALGAVVLPLLPAAECLMPYGGRNLWDDLMMLRNDHDPFRILEQAPLAIPRPVEGLVALARADWKETPQAHLISLDVPGVKREDIKIEVEDNRILRVSGERRAEEEAEGDKWHRAERTSGRFWRQFRMPASADLNGIRAHLEDGVLRIAVPKVAEVIKRQPKVVEIVEEKGKGGGEEIKASA